MSGSGASALRTNSISRRHQMDIFLILLMGRLRVRLSCFGFHSLTAQRLFLHTRRMVYSPSNPISKDVPTVCDPFGFFFQAEDGIRDYKVTGVQTCALPIQAEDGIGFKTGFRRVLFR